MAGSAIAGAGPYVGGIGNPQTRAGLVPIKLGPITFLASETDPAALVSMAAHKMNFDGNVKAADLYMRDGSWVSGVGMEIKIVDDTGTPQVIVAAYSVTTDDDAGTIMPLTIADEGPLLTGGTVFLQFDPGDTNGEVRDLTVTLWVQPLYAL